MDIIASPDGFKDLRSSAANDPAKQAIPAEAVKIASLWDDLPKGLQKAHAMT